MVLGSKMFLASPGAPDLRWAANTRGLWDLIPKSFWTPENSTKCVLLKPVTNIAGAYQLPITGVRANSTEYSH